jgi:hypothetical protein
MADENALEIRLERVRLAEVDEQAKRLRAMYDVYRSLRRVTDRPGEFNIDLAIREGGEERFVERDLSGERLRADAARYRILRALKEHVVEHGGDVQSFELAFHLKCREIPDEIEVSEPRIGPVR